MSPTTTTIDTESRIKVEDGVKYLSHGQHAYWFTNLDTTKRHETMILYKRYSPEKYPPYDNYDAIEVARSPTSRRTTTESWACRSRSSTSTTPTSSRSSASPESSGVTKPISRRPPPRTAQINGGKVRRRHL